MFGFGKKKKHEVKKLKEEIKIYAVERSESINQENLEASKKKLIILVTSYPGWIQEANKPFVLQNNLKIKDTLRNFDEKDILSTASISFKYQFELPPFIGRTVTLTPQGDRKRMVKKATVEDVDPLFDTAVNIVLETRKASISGVQRRLKIGYNRAAKFIDQMEAKGLVGPMESNGHRVVLAPPPSSEIEKPEYDILSNLNPELEKYYAEIRPDPHPKNPKDIKTNIELLYEPKMCVYHLDVLFMQLDKASKEVVNVILNSSQLFKKRVFVEFWEEMEKVNTSINWFHSLVKMINEEVRQYNSAIKDITARNLGKVSSPPLIHASSFDVEEVKLQAKSLSETLDSAKSDFEFSSMFQQMKKGDGFFTNDMKYINSMSDVLFNALSQLNKCITEINKRGEVVNEQSALVKDFPKQKTQKTKARKKPKISIPSSEKEVSKEEVTGRKARRDTNISNDEEVTGRKPRSGGSVAQDDGDITGRKPRVANSNDQVGYTGRKPR